MEHAPIKIIIADDHPIVRQGLRQMIETDKSLQIVAEADNGETVLQLIETHQPQVAVLDIDMPQMGGFDVAREIRRKNTNLEIVFLTMHSEEEIFQTAMDLGVKGYILKDSATSDIVAAIKSVAAGKPFISLALTALLLNRRRRIETARIENPGLDALSPTERRVLQLIAEDKTSREIAKELFISHRTVETHRVNISRKLDLRGNLALVKFAIKHKSEL